MFASDPFVDMLSWKNFLHETYDIKLRQDEMVVRFPAVQSSKDKFRVAVIPRGITHTKALEAMYRHVSVGGIKIDFDTELVRGRTPVMTQVYWTCNTSGPCRDYFGRSYAELSSNPTIAHSSLLHEITMQTYYLWFARTHRKNPCYHATDRRIMCSSVTKDGYPVTIGYNPDRKRIEIGLIDPEEKCPMTSIRPIHQ
jgi:hypothetical protein